MLNNNIYRSDVELIAESYFENIENTFGLALLSFSVSLTALSYSNAALAQVCAGVAYTTIFYLAYTKGIAYRKIKDSYLKGFKGISGSLSLMLKTPLFIVLSTYLAMLALGEVDIVKIIDLVKSLGSAGE